MFSKSGDMSIRARLVIWSVIASGFIMMMSTGVAVLSSHAYLFGNVRDTMTRVATDLAEEYVEYGGLTPEFLHCLNEDAQEHDVRRTCISVIDIGTPGKELCSTPKLHEGHIRDRHYSVMLKDGRKVVIRRDVTSLDKFLFFLGLTLCLISLFSMVGTGMFAYFIGGRILKLNQIVEDKNRAYDELKVLTDDIAHDLRTPLTRLHMAAESVLTAGESNASLAEQVIDDTGAMVDMINTSLEISQAGFRIDRTPREEIDIVSLLRKSCDLYSAVADDRGVKLELDAPDSPIWFSGHKAKLQQVVGNLLDNAFKFTPRGGRVSVTVSHDEKAMALKVSDTGCGIAEADIPHVFQRFWRADSSRNLPGNGLGLALVRAIVTSYGGNITCSSTVGEGTTFSVVFPFQ